MEPLQIGGRTYTLQLAPNPVLPTADIIADLVVDFLTDFNTRRHPEQEAIWDKYRETILYDCEILAAQLRHTARTIHAWQYLPADVGGE